MNAIAEPVQASHSRERSALGWLRSRRQLVFGGLAVTLLLMAGTFGRPWLEALGIGSVVLGLLPCAAMCAVGAVHGRAWRLLEAGRRARRCGSAPGRSWRSGADLKEAR